MEKYPKNREAVQGWLIVNMKRVPTGELDAIKQLEELELKYPDNTGILFFKAFIQAEYNQMDDVLKSTEKLIALEPEDGLNWLLRGQVLEGAGRNEEALTAYQKSTTLAPENADSWHNLAGLHAKPVNLTRQFFALTRRSTLHRISLFSFITADAATVVKVTRQMPLLISRRPSA